MTKILEIQLPYIALEPESYSGQIVGTGKCVDFVREASGAPTTSDWVEGQKARGSQLKPGTVIATFQDGRYPNNSTGNHAAVFVSQNSDGLIVWDQWRGQSVHKRLIRFKGGEGSPSNDGDAFYVVE